MTLTRYLRTFAANIDQVAFRCIRRAGTSIILLDARKQPGFRTSGFAADRI
jgi:hypothetical protein